MSKVYVYHHNDHDGIVAAGILRIHLIDVEKRNKEDIIFYSIGYHVELNFDHIDFTNRDKVYFLDYSFSNEHNRNEFEKLLKRRVVARDVRWIDHHKTSIGMLEEYDIPGIRDTSLCGAAWTYLFCKGNLNEWLEYDNISKLFHEAYYIPPFLKHIDDYDCWKKIYPDTNYLHYGLRIAHPGSPLIRVLLRNDKRAKEKIRNIISKGEIIVKNNEFEDKAYHIGCYGFEFTLPEEHGGLHCFCINRKGNSIMFGDKINEYDAVMPFYFIKGKWNYSLFSNKENVDCSEVAKSYGGGGHKGAAGWVSKEFIFSEV